jgi:hypothetical protein
VSGHITALAISGMMISGVSFVSFVGDRADGPVGKHHIWFACCTVSAKMSFDSFCPFLMRLTMEGGVVGVPALHWVGLNLCCEFGVTMYDWVMQNSPPSDLKKCEIAPYSSSIYSWLSNEPLCLKI